MGEFLREVRSGATSTAPSNLLLHRVSCLELEYESENAEHSLIRLGVDMTLRILVSAWGKYAYSILNKRCIKLPVLQRMRLVKWLTALAVCCSFAGLLLGGRTLLRAQDAEALSQDTIEPMPPRPDVSFLMLDPDSGVTVIQDQTNHSCRHILLNTQVNIEIGDDLELLSKTLLLTPAQRLNLLWLRRMKTARQICYLVAVMNGTHPLNPVLAIQGLQSLRDNGQISAEAGYLLFMDENTAFNPAPEDRYDEPTELLSGDLDSYFKLLSYTFNKRLIAEDYLCNSDLRLMHASRGRKTALDSFAAWKQAHNGLVWKEKNRFKGHFLNIFDCKPGISPLFEYYNEAYDFRKIGAFFTLARNCRDISASAFILSLDSGFVRFFTEAIMTQMSPTIESLQSILSKTLKLLFHLDLVPEFSRLCRLPSAMQLVFHLAESRHFILALRDVNTTVAIDDPEAFDRFGYHLQPPSFESASFVALLAPKLLGAHACTQSATSISTSAPSHFFWRFCFRNRWAFHV
eukprot:Gregarina_sp_Poly_1__11508@NODE_995_length_5435_cov_497_780179_g698_i0_p1_GENE_NODE_995_length_5435_cov_497_780179_g698_i0NODE_995_length_5435_cov_497_780179_g698_i0_p1_ORF_typecomplete_len517_score50_41_NODE_995_length_5435_cov_497_780179_g698_i024433993